VADSPIPILYRQGDVLLMAVDSVPADAQPVARDDGRIVLAYGEVTGHAHAIDAPESEATLLSVSEERRFLRLMADVDLAHEEHATIHLPPGVYRVIRQRVWGDAVADAEARLAEATTRGETRAARLAEPDEYWMYAGD